MRSLDLSTHTGDEATVVTVQGSVDAVTAPRLTEALEAEVDAGNVRLVLDLAAVEYVSSAGLRTILATLKRARGGGGDLRLAAVQPDVQKVFELSGFTSILSFYDDASQAASSFA